MTKSLVAKFVIYQGRWQLSTPILAPIIIQLAHLGHWSAVIANVVGACIFFLVDRYIFTGSNKAKGKLNLLRQFGLYHIRWQATTPTLAGTVYKLSHLGYWEAVTIANIIGACIFFWVDKWIFKPKGVEQ